MSDIPHPSDYIAEELMVRGWSADDLAFRMSDGSQQDFGICRIALDFYDTIGPDNTCMRIGQETIGRLAGAFDVSPEYFANLESAWLRSKGVHPTTTDRRK